MAPGRGTLVGLAAALLHLAAAQWPAIDPGWQLASATKWFRWHDADRTLPDAIRGQAAELLAERREAVAALQSEADWRHRSATVREKFSQIFEYSALSDAPERRTPLNPRITKCGLRRTDCPPAPPSPTLLYLSCLS